MRMKNLVATVLLICIFLMVPVFEVFAMQIQIQVGVNGGRTITLEVGPSDSIATLKSMVQETANISLENRVLLFGGEELSDNTLTLENYGITDGATIIIAGPYTVTLNMDGHGDNQTLTVKYGESPVLPALSDEGYTFLYWYWYNDEGLAVQFNPETGIYADTVIYAKWVISHTVTYNMNGHGENQTVTVNDGDYLPWLEPSADGFTFNGWYTNAELTEEYNHQLAIYADTVLYAKWLEIHTVSFDTYGMCNAIEPLKVTHGWTTELPEPQAPEGYAFVGWSSDENGHNQVSSLTPITEDLTLYSLWAIQADNPTIIDNNITIHFDNYPVPDQPLTTDGVYIDAGDNTSLIQLGVPVWTEWDYYAFDENRFPTTECKPSADNGSILHFRAGKYYMYNCKIRTVESTDPRISILVPNVALPVNAASAITIDCPNMLDYQCWNWSWYTDPETGEKFPFVLELALVFKAPEYKVIEDEITDTTFETGTDDTVTLHFNGDISLFDELVIDGNVVPKDQYTLTEGSTIVTLKSSYLETLGNGDHTVTAVYNTNMDNVDNAKDEVSAVITVQKSEDKPAEPDPTTPGNNTDPTSGNGTAPASVPTATPINSSGSPNTGDITSITGYLVSGALSLAGIVGINKKRRK